MLVPHRVSREAPIGAHELLLERKAGDEALPRHVTSVLSMHFCLHTEVHFKIQVHFVTLPRFRDI